MLNCNHGKAHTSRRKVASERVSAIHRKGDTCERDVGSQRKISIE